MSIATAELRAELRKEISEWKSRALKAEADAKGWEEMHNRAAEARDVSVAARLKAEADAENWRAEWLAASEHHAEYLKDEEAARLKAEAALRAVTETVHSAELPGVAKLIAIDLIVRAALPLEPTP